MKKLLSLLLCAAMLALTACGGRAVPPDGAQTGTAAPNQPTDSAGEHMVPDLEGAVSVELSDAEIRVDGQTASTDAAAAVYVGAPIVYYEDGKDFTYGEGEEGDAHCAQEAAAHTVVTITRPGTYVLSGKLSAGQVAVDLGEDAGEDPEAVVTLVLNGVDITCTVAPAVIFYNVYECGSDNVETAVRDVDTTAAGANVYISGGTGNNICGSYVARIYKPGSVVLSADGTEVEEAKKLHKYDAAFYSRMSMNVDGDHSGVLHIDAENEGLDSELHLTINGGSIHITSGNDGINTNEDHVSVTTINGGNLTIQVTGATGEGDGIDSNGWLVINGGTVVAAACNNSADAGIDSDMGIHIGAGATVIATGHMLDRIEGSGQNYAVFGFGGIQSGEEVVSLRSETGSEIMNVTPINDYSVLVYSAPTLTEGDYTLWSGGTQLGHAGARNGMGGMMMPGGFAPGGMEPPEGFDPGGMEPPEGFDPGGMERPEPPEGMQHPEGFDPPQMGPGSPGSRGDRNPGSMSAATAESLFAITGRENYFFGVGVLTAP